MKANEAPEKIYLQDSMSTDTIGDLWPEWFDAEVSDNSIEYTRTDAFIEKACDAFCKVRCKGKPLRSTCTSLGTCREYDDIKNYMKG